MPLCVELSKYIGKHVFATGLETPVFNEIFVVPEVVRPDKYHEFMTKRSLTFLDRESYPIPFQPSWASQEISGVKRNPGMYGMPFGEPKSPWRPWRKEMQHKIPGFPMFLTLSGKAFYGWTGGELLDFVSDGIDMLVKKYHVYPALSLISIQPDSEEKAQEMAEKIRKIDEFRSRYVL